MNRISHSQRTGFSQERLHRLSTVLQGYVERGEIAGLVALIIQLRGAQLPQSSKIAQDFWTMIYQAIID